MSPTAVPDTNDGSGPRSNLPRQDPTAWLHGLGAFLLTATYVPALLNTPISDRAIVILIGGAVGLGSFVELISRRDDGARWLGGFLLWALIGCLLSTDPIRTIIPGTSQHRAWFLFLAYAGWWAIGRRADHEARRAILVGLLAGGAVNIAVAIAQALVEDGTGLLITGEDRVGGFFVVSVYLGAFLAGIGLLTMRFAQRTDDPRWWWATLPLAVCAAITNLTGSRIAVAVLIGLALGAAVMGNRRRGAVLFLAIIAGILVSIPMQTNTGTGRVADTSGGMIARTEAWKSAIPAATERPLQGWGIGRWEEATLPEITSRFVRHEGINRIFSDAHNLPIEALITTGVVGLALLTGFAVTALRRTRGPHAWAAGAIALTWLLEPVHPALAAIVLLLIGVGWQRIDDGERAERRAMASPVRAVTAVAVTVATLFGTVYAVAAVTMERSGEPADATQRRRTVETAYRWLPTDRDIRRAEITAQLDEAHESDDQGERHASLVAVVRFAESDPTDFRGWLLAGEAEATLGPGTREERLESARTAYMKAYERHPWQLDVLTALQAINRGLGNHDAAATWRERLCEIDQCLAEEPAP